MLSEGCHWDVKWMSLGCQMLTIIRNIFKYDVIDYGVVNHDIFDDFYHRHINITKNITKSNI